MEKINAQHVRILRVLGDYTFPLSKSEVARKISEVKQYSRDYLDRLFKDLIIYGLVKGRENVLFSLTNLGTMAISRTPIAEPALIKRLEMIGAYPLPDINSKLEKSIDDHPAVKRAPPRTVPVSGIDSHLNLSSSQKLGSKSIEQAKKHTRTPKRKKTNILPQLKVGQIESEKETSMSIIEKEFPEEILADLMFTKQERDLLELVLQYRKEGVFDKTIPVPTHLQGALNSLAVRGYLYTGDASKGVVPRLTSFALVEMGLDKSQDRNLPNTRLFAISYWERVLLENTHQHKRKTATISRLVQVLRDCGCGFSTHEEVKSIIASLVQKGLLSYYPPNNMNMLKVENYERMKHGNVPKVVEPVDSKPSTVDEVVDPVEQLKDQSDSAETKTSPEPLGLSEDDGDSKSIDGENEKKDSEMTEELAEKEDVTPNEVPAPDLGGAIAYFEKNKSEREARGNVQYVNLKINFLEHLVEIHKSDKGAGPAIEFLEDIISDYKNLQK